MQGYSFFLACSALVVLMTGVALVAYLYFLRDMLRNQQHQLKVAEAMRDNYKALWERLEDEDERRGKATRAEVYSAIDSERHFQEELKRRGVYSAEKKTLRAWVQLIDAYCDMADKALAQRADDRGPALDKIRKVAALAVCAMEEHGAPFCTQKVN